jgi:ADP-heptose:LPS heptosyltransferase
MKILVIALAGIGDTLIATPLIHELRANFPDAQIDALVRWPGARDLLEGNPHLNTVHQKDFVKAGKFPTLKFLSILRKENYDVSINAHPQSRTEYRIISRIIGARQRISHFYECSGVLDRFLISDALAQDYSRHSIEQNFDVLPLLGAAPKLSSHDMEVYLSNAEIAWADSFIGEHGLTGRKILGVHVGSGSTKNLMLKRWPLENYIELFRKLKSERPDMTVLLFGGPDEEKDFQKILAEFTERRSPIRREGGAKQAASETGAPFIGRAATKNFRQAAALMQKCSGFLSVDTVLMHVAAAMKVPNQIVIEAMTLNATNVPYGNKYTLVRNPAVAGCHLEFYRYDGADIKGTREELLRIMKAVTVEEVFAVVNKQLPP